MCHICRKFSAKFIQRINPNKWMPMTTQTTNNRCSFIQFVFNIAITTVPKNSSNNFCCEHKNTAQTLVFALVFHKKIMKNGYFRFSFNNCSQHNSVFINVYSIHTKLSQWLEQNDKQRFKRNIFKHTWP